MAALRVKHLLCHATPAEVVAGRIVELKADVTDVGVIVGGELERVNPVIKAEVDHKPPRRHAARVRRHRILRAKCSVSCDLVQDVAVPAVAFVIRHNQLVEKLAHGTVQRRK